MVCQKGGAVAVYDDKNNDFDRFVTLYLAEQDKRNEELRERDFQIRILRIVNTLLTILLLTSLTALGWLYFGHGVHKSEVPENGEYISITLDEMSRLRKSNIARAKHDYVDNFYQISGNISKIDDDIKYITLLNPDDMKDMTAFKFNVNDDSVKDAISAHNLGDRLTLNCKCKSVGRWKGYEFDIIEISNGETEEYTVVPLEELAMAKNDDFSAAKSAYTNKKIITEGKVAKIDKNFDYFTLYDYHNKNNKNTYKFYVPSALKQQTRILSIDEAIRVKGICTGVGLVNGYEFALEEIFTDPTEYDDVKLSQLSYALTTNFDEAKTYKDRFLKFIGKYDSYDENNDRLMLKNPENDFDKNIYTVYLNGSDVFKQAVKKLDPNQEVTVYVRCRDVNRFNGYEFDLKEIDGE